MNGVQTQKIKSIGGRCLVSVLLATSGIFVAYVGYTQPDWTLKKIAHASDTETRQQPRVPEISVKSVANCGEKPLVENSTASDGQAKTAIETNMVENTQDIPDAIEREGSFEFTYYEGGIYKIYCKEGYLTDIQLQAGETITAILGGDTARWMVDKAQSGTGNEEQWHVYVKPLKSGISTNFIINTDRHSYQIQVRSTDWYTPTIGWVYPTEIATIFRKKEEKDRETVDLSHTVPERLNFNYKIEKKNYRWTPLTVFDDGVKTYIKMPTSMSSDEAPALLIKESNGGLMLVNYRVQGNCYIVDRLFDRAVMKVGKDCLNVKRVDG